MRTFREVAGRELDWVRVGPRKARSFELRAGDEAVAELAFDSLRSDHARARSADGGWRFERQGITRPGIRITRDGIGAAVDPVSDGSPGPVLEGALHPDRLFRPTAVEVRGQRYRWGREGLLSPWRSLDDDTGPLIRARPVGLGMPGRGSLEIRAAAFARPELPVLALVAWYLTARRQGKEHG